MKAQFDNDSYQYLVPLRITVIVQYTKDYRETYDIGQTSMAIPRSLHMSSNFGCLASENLKEKKPR